MELNVQHFPLQKKKEREKVLQYNTVLFSVGGAGRDVINELLRNKI